MGSRDISPWADWAVGTESFFLSQLPAPIPNCHNCRVPDYTFHGDRIEALSRRINLKQPPFENGWLIFISATGGDSAYQ